MKIKIGKDGTLYKMRAGAWKDMWCPFNPAADPCGDWCPLFDGPNYKTAIITITLHCGDGRTIYEAAAEDFIDER